VRSSRGSGTGSGRGRDPGRSERQARGQAGERQDGEQVPVVEVGDRQGAWALGTLTALLSGDWLNAREPAGEALHG
jgi:hypothetical protein